MPYPENGTRVRITRAPWNTEAEGREGTIVGYQPGMLGSGGLYDVRLDEPLESLREGFPNPDLIHVEEGEMEAVQ